MSCPPQTPIEVSPGFCASACPSGYVQSTEDVYECVSSIACPVGFTAVTGNNTQCRKPAPLTITQGQSCGVGYDEWEQNKCYVSCPAGFTDNGLSCIKNSFTRDAHPLAEQCNTIFQYAAYEGAACTFSPIGLWIITLCVIGFVWLFYIMYKFIQRSYYRSTHRLTNDEEILEQINGYFKP